MTTPVHDLSPVSDGDILYCSYPDLLLDEIDHGLDDETLQVAVANQQDTKGSAVFSRLDCMDQGQWWPNMEN